MLIYFTFVATALASAYAIGKALDDVTQPEVKRTAYRWLTDANFSPDYSQNLHTTLVVTFTTIFTDNPVSIRFILRSTLLSALGSLILALLLYLAISLHSVPDLIGLRETLRYPSFIFAACLSFIVISISDYLCLAKTAIIITSRYFERFPWRHYFLDVAISLIIGFTFGFFAILLIDSIGDNFEFLKIINIRPILGFSFITCTLPTFMSLDLALGGTIARLICKTGIPFELAKSRFLDIEQKPFSSTALLLWPFITIVAVIALANAA